MLQNRVPIWEVAGFVGTSEKVIREDLWTSLARPLERSENRVLWAKTGQATLKGRKSLANSLKELVAEAVGCEPVSEAATGICRAKTQIRSYLAHQARKFSLIHRDFAR